MDSLNIYSHGKLLITGEYLVLDGAEALAIPCKFGQSLRVKATTSDKSTWVGYDHKGEIWLETEFNIHDVLHQTEHAKDEIEKRLFQILGQLNAENSKVLTQNYDFETRLEFPRNWGLGTSSTLIANLSKWAGVNPYTLLSHTFGGSGYDIACADAESPIVFQLEAGQPKFKPASLPSFLMPYVYFIHLEEKQDSREAIATYRKTKPSNLKSYIAKINQITQELQQVKTLDSAQNLIKDHESLLSELLNIPPVQQRLFPDFDGQVKSLGGWGGDFVMAVSKTNPEPYFHSKGFTTVLKYQEMSI